MKKQGSIYLKVVFGVIGVFFITYLVLRAIPSAEESRLYTETAVAYEVGDGVTTTGFVVRDERIMTGTDPLLALQRQEGEWVGVGEAVATAFSDADARAKQVEIDSIEEELGQLEYAYAHAAANADAAVLDSNITAEITQTAVYVSQRNMTAVQDSTGKLKTYILRRYTGEDDSAALWQRITELRQEVEQLEAAAEPGASALYAPEAGYFSSNVDGYESLLTPDSLSEMTVSRLEELSSEQVSAPVNALCKVITSNTWYYVTAVDSEALKNCSVGDRISVRFAYDLSDDVSMKVVRVGSDENGQGILILSADRYVFETTSMRRQTADIVFQTYSGLRVPKQALYVNEDGEAGVYILEGASAAWKAVTIIRDNGDSYIVTLDKSSTDNLWPGDEIIVTSEELYDGKVVAS